MRRFLAVVALLASSLAGAAQTTIPTNYETQPWQWNLNTYGICYVGGAQIAGSNVVLVTEVIAGQSGFNFMAVRDATPTTAWYSTTTPQLWGAGIDSDQDWCIVDYTNGSAQRFCLHNSAGGAVSFPFLTSCDTIDSNGSGTLACGTDDDVPEAADYSALTCGAGILCSPTGTILTASDESDFLKSGALTCGASTQGKAQVHTTPLQYCDNTATPVLRYAAYGSSSGVATSATGLAANGANCSAGNYPLGVDASGAAESCTADDDVPEVGDFGALASASTLFAFTADITPTALAADTDDWNPTGLSTAAVIRASASTPGFNVTGLQGGADGRVIILHNVGSFPITLKDETTSTAANRFALTADVALATDAVVAIQYDSTSSRWRMIGGSGSGGGGLSGLTTNQVLKAGSSTTAVDASITDDGTDVYLAAGHRLGVGISAFSGHYPYEPVAITRDGDMAVGFYNTSSPASGNAGFQFGFHESFDLGGMTANYAMVALPPSDPDDSYTSTLGLYWVGLGTDGAGVDSFQVLGVSQASDHSTTVTFPDDVLVAGTVSVTDGMDLNSTVISNVADPGGPQEAATKNYVDTIAAGGCQGMLRAITFNPDETTDLYYSLNGGTGNATLANVADVPSPNDAIDITHIAVWVDVDPGNSGGTKSWIVSLCDDASCSTGVSCTIAGSGGGANKKCGGTGSATVAAQSMLALSVSRTGGTPATAAKMSVSFCTNR